MALISVVSFGQNGTVKGTIIDKKNGQPILYGNVILEGTTIGAITNENGFYTITGIVPGSYTLLATYIGYDTSRADFKIVSSEIVNKSLYLSESSIKLGVIDISARREEARSEVRISKVRVTPTEIKALPSTGADADIVQYLQVLPGIISTGDQGGQLYIRGGSPVQNKILLDGLTIYNPFHSIGFYSIFETELIKNVDVLTGGFNSEYGGRISAIVDINTRDGDKTRFGGQVSGSPFMVKGLFEGPIKKYEEGKSNASFVFTSKKSIIDETSKTLYDYASVNDSIGLPFNFQDTYGKLTFTGASGSQVNLFGFSFTDGYNNPAIANIGWDNVGGGVNFIMVPSNSNYILGGIIGYSDYEIKIDEEARDQRKSRIKELSAGLDFTFFGVNNEVKYGFDIKAIRTEFDFTNPFNTRLTQFQNTTEISGYVNYRQVIGDLVIEPGVRLQHYASQSAFSPEPRIGIKYNVSERLRLKAAGGLYTQNLLSTSNERDVVNLFQGFLSGPESRVNGFDGNQIKNKLQKATHAIAGVEYDLADGMEINVEGYLKDFSQLIIVNRNKLTANDPDYSTETGEAYGVDVSFRWDRPKTYLWLTYSWGNVNRYDGEQDYSTIFDRRHNVNLLATYRFDEAGDFQISARWNMGSGFPFTKTQGFYNHNSFIEGVSTPFQVDNPDDVGIIFSDTRNGGRLPYYHRLDISASKIFHFTEYINMEVTASVSNAYDRDNIFYFDRVEYERVDQLPIIPSIGVKINF